MRIGREIFEESGHSVEIAVDVERFSDGIVAAEIFVSDFLRHNDRKRLRQN